MDHKKTRTVIVAFFTVLTIGLGSTFVYQAVKVKLSNSQAASRTFTPTPTPSETPNFDNLVPHDE
ncbi:MAG: hypothetical protein A3A33_02500 [Candidatus Yanofskybacteria bacterium RIFCSPLOWO2_01_FULL_49_25]|uniref:Uncharacterized protein n=1 Tax=Candidatus Yanofskybacteria bacterium RIFCSPLOWO2_01_FULL_49_25 TaxID=1802701 RepID=A0A1F8GRZ7_9BACT|nr:MAG: hypothetical protein A3A33_02500 [Candidatus Yanofskybacteria bacterium RIFCSPLOWO2_01_FULL_49_25]